MKTNHTYLGTYYFLSCGYCQSTTAKRLAVSESSVSTYASKLVSEGYLTPIKSHSNPRLYNKGKRGDILDKAIIELNLQFNGGTVPTSSTSNISTSENNIYIPTSRAHINGRVVFSVDKVGDLHTLRIPLIDRKMMDVPLFPTKPAVLANGVREYRTKLPWEGQQVSVHYIESDKGASSLHVWPHQKELLPDQISNNDGKYFIEEAQHIANYLAKHGGWRFGPGQFKGEIHYASTNPAILAMIPEEMKNVPGSPYWIDNSQGPREIETKDPEAAKLLFNFTSVVKNLQSGQESTINRIFILEQKADLMLVLLEKFVTIMEKDAELTASIVEKEIITTAGKVVSVKSSQNVESQTPYEGMMFR